MCPGWPGLREPLPGHTPPGTGERGRDAFRAGLEGREKTGASLFPASDGGEKSGEFR
jgi:hypothetical protein